MLSIKKALQKITYLKIVTKFSKNEQITFLHKIDLIVFLGYQLSSFLNSKMFTY